MGCVLRATTDRGAEVAWRLPDENSVSTEEKILRADHDGQRMVQFTNDRGIKERIDLSRLISWSTEDGERLWCPSCHVGYAIVTNSEKIRIKMTGFMECPSCGGGYSIDAWTPIRPGAKP